LAIREPIPPPVARASDGASSNETALEAQAAGLEAGGGTTVVGEAGRGGFSVSGAGRSYASIWQGTQRYLAGLRWAYSNELHSHAGLRGVIVVRYEILSDGAVGDVAMVSSELQAPRLEQQVLSQIRDWRYLPEATGTVVVTWPFSFRPPR
jgi:TonB family protein